MSSAATDWANKRRAQILRAERLRAERKSGGVAEGDTFQPQLSGRGSKGITRSNYGQNGSNGVGDSLDNLAGTNHKTGNAAYDDVFEVPLPGAKGASKAKQQIHEYTDGQQSGQNLSPGSDTLGREMRRHSQDYDVEGDVDPTSRYLSAHQEMTRNKGSSSSRDRAIGGEGGYKSKFMKQYESPVVQQRKTAHHQPEGYDDDGDGEHGSPGGRRGFVFNGEDLGEQQEQYGNVRDQGAIAPAERESARARSKAAAQARVEAQNQAEKEAEDEFMRSLRSGSKPQKSGKPGWNDDFSDTAASNGLFGEPKPVPKRKTRTSTNAGVSSKVDTGLRTKSASTRSGSGSSQNTNGIVNVGDDMPLPTQMRRDHNNPHPGFGSEYPEEYDSSQYGGGGGRERRPVPARSNSPSQAQVGASGESQDNNGGSGQKAHARSRLSLLKNKIRMSENSQEGRSSRSSLKGSLERSRSDLHEQYSRADNGSGKYNFEYGSDNTSNLGHGSEGGSDTNGDYGGSYSYSHSQSDKYSHPGYGDGQGARSPHARETRGPQARAANGGAGGSGGRTRRAGRAANGHEVDASTGRYYEPGQGPSSPQQYRSRYSESVFDASDHPGNADLYPSRDRTRQRYDNDYSGGEAGNEGGYQLDALDHYNTDTRAGGKGAGAAGRGRRTSSASTFATTATTSSSNGTWDRDGDRDRDSGTYDIYAAAADLPGAYPEGEGPPAEVEEYHQPAQTTSRYGASRFNEYDEEQEREEHKDVQHIFNGDSYDGRGTGGRNRGQGSGRRYEEYGEGENPYAQSKVAKRNREREREKEKERERAQRALAERERGWNDDTEMPLPREESGGGYGGRMTERERARAKPSSGRMREREKPPQRESERGGYSAEYEEPQFPQRQHGGSGSRRAARPTPAMASTDPGNSSSNSAYDLSHLGEEDMGDYAPPQPQRQCHDCGRSFNVDAFEKHAKICAKVFMSKRKTFDSKKARIMGLAEQNGQEAVKIAKEGLRNQRRDPGGQGRSRAQRGGGGGSNSKWAEESRAFRDAMRAAREVSKAQKTGAPLPPSIPSGPDPSLIPCPHCGRRFNAKAADRHIPQCQNIKAKPSRLLKNSGMGAVASAKKGAATRRGVTF